MDESTEAKAKTQKTTKHLAWLDHKISVPKDEAERNIWLGIPLLFFQAQSGLCSVDNKETLDRTSFKLYLLVFFFCGCVRAYMCEFVCVLVCMCMHVRACVCVLVHAHVEIKRYIVESGSPPSRGFLGLYSGHHQTWHLAANVLPSECSRELQIGHILI